MPTVNQVFELLEEVHDPELWVSIVDLGLVYDVRIGGNKISIDRTLTFPGCPAEDIIEQEIKDRLKMIGDGIKVNVNLVWDPPWNHEMMTEEARLELGYAT